MDVGVISKLPHQNWAFEQIWERNNSLFVHGRRGLRVTNQRQYSNCVGPLNYSKMFFRGAHAVEQFLVGCTQGLHASALLGMLNLKAKMSPIYIYANILFSP